MNEPIPRYRELVAELSSECSPAIQTLLDHRSVRKFAPAPVPPGTLEMLVAAGQSASTSSNKQFWSVIAVEDPERKSRLAALCDNQTKINGAPLLLVWLADLSRIRSLGRGQGAELAGLDYLESFLIAVIDATLAAQNAAVAAEASGLGVVYIGAMRDHPEEVAQELGLPDECFAVFGMCVGYPDPAAPTAVKPRLPQEAVLYRERYSAANQLDAVRRYEGHNNAFREEQGMPPMDWSVQIASRVRTGDSLKTRQFLREALQKRGFALR